MKVDSVENPIVQVASDPISHPQYVGNKLQWVEDWIYTLHWEKIQSEIESFISRPCPKFTDIVESLEFNNIYVGAPLKGFSKLDPTKGYVAAQPEGLPFVMVYDFEAVRKYKEAPYKPFLLTIWGSDGFWYVWTPDTSILPNTILFPKNRILIGHNSASYDRRYLRCEYDPQGMNFHFDTQCMATRICGISNQQTAGYVNGKKSLGKGKGAPAWVTHASTVGLDALCKYFLGIEISKTVRDDQIAKKLESDYNFNQIPRNEVEYCAQDVWATFHLFGVLWHQLNNSFFNSLITWWGQIELSQSCIYLKGLEEFLGKSEDAYQTIQSRIARIMKKVAEDAKREGLRQIESRKAQELQKLNLWENLTLEVIPDITNPLDGEDLLSVLNACDSSKNPLGLGLLFTQLDERINLRLYQRENTHGLDLGVCGSVLNHNLSSILTLERSGVGDLPNNIPVGKCSRPLQLGKQKTGWVKALKDIKAFKSKLFKVVEAAFKKEYKALERNSLSWNPDYGFYAQYPLEWNRLSSGPDEGKVVWYRDLQDKNFGLGGRIPVYLMQFDWEGQRIYYDSWKNESGNPEGTWKTMDGEPLPHPTKAGGNLGSPFCADYLPHVEQGKLTSSVVSKETLLKLFEWMIEISQWEGYRDRYNNIYRVPQNEVTFKGQPLPPREDHFVWVTDTSPSKTVSGRQVSPVTMVSPKPSAGKLGCEFMNHLTVPDGYQVVLTDFDGQELWFTTLLTDCFAGNIASNRWCEAVLNGVNTGDLATSTDDHSMVAKTVGSSRSNAKTLNFGLNYGGGLEKLAHQMNLATGIPLEKTLVMAAHFLFYKKGNPHVFKQLAKVATQTLGYSLQAAAQYARSAQQSYEGEVGIAKSTFDLLGKLADKSGIRTGVLGVKIPNSLEPGYVKGEFFTTRQNWQIQAGCVDVLHLILAILRIFGAEYGLDYWFMLAIHDSLSFAVKNEQVDLFEQVLQESHKLTKQISYEQGTKHARALTRKNIPAVECPENQYWFSSIGVGESIGAVI